MKLKQQLKAWNKSIISVKKINDIKALGKVRCYSSVPVINLTFAIILNTTRTEVSGTPRISVLQKASKPINDKPPGPRFIMPLVWKQP